ncbi:MAG: CU044_5270 family protein [Nocardiopsaceae bacterium]|jgi:hypothetical protein|nr:CU044_5270 family protein [Nocardiopsaceae bacterium]
MNEMDVLQRLRDDVPSSQDVSRAEDELFEAIRAETAAEARLAKSFVPAKLVHGGRRGRQRSWSARQPARLAMAGALSLALAAGITSAVVSRGNGNGSHWKASPAVRDLAYRAATVASTRVNVPAHHWVYWLEQEGSGPKAHVWRVWTTADGQKAAYRLHGKTHLIDLHLGKKTGLPPGGQYIGQPEISVVPPPYGGVTIGTLSGTIPVRYGDLRKLPDDPRALVDYLGHLPMPGSESPEAQAFNVIVELMQTYVLPPQLTGELFRALAYIPGVTVDKHAVDVAGRPGVGFEFGQGLGGKQELVIDPHSYRLMGVQLVRDQHGPDGQVVFDGGTAILRMALVKGPGVLP